MNQGILHDSYASDIHRMCAELAILSRTEYGVRVNGRCLSIDVAAWIANRFVAIEIETTVHHIDKTIAKVCMAGAELWIVVPTRKLRGQMRNKLRRLDLYTDNGRFKLLLQSQVEQEFANSLSQSTPANR